MSRMLKSSGAVGAATLASRLLGMVREMVYAGFMGDSWVASAFVYAFMIPNLFRRLLGEGALTAAFIPLFKEKEKCSGDAEMWRAANAVISGLVAVSLGVIGLTILGTTGLLAFRWIEGETRLMLELLRIMFPYMLMACLTAVFMGMLNARGIFFIPALGATLLNVVMIASVYWLAPRFGAKLPQQIFGLAFGVLVAGVVQMTFQLPNLRREGFHFAWVSPWRNDTVREVSRKMLPAIIGVAVFQINVVLTQGLGFWVGKEIVASFNYAVRLMELPQGVFGASLAAYMLPTLAGLAAEKKYDAFRATLSQGLGYLIYINALASMLLLVLAKPIIRLLFERGAFDESSTDRAAFALACLALGLVGYSVVNILARAFYALGDTKTPMLVSLVCLVLNLVFTIPLVLVYRQGGLGLANTLSSVFNVWLLMYALRRKLKRLAMAELARHLIPVLAAMILAGQTAWIIHLLWETSFGHARVIFRLGAVFVPMGAASFTYWLVTYLWRVPQARELWALFRKRTRL